MALTLLAINLIGFAPTYFLRTWFGGTALSLRTHLHAFLFTSWFLLLVVQSALVARGRLGSHRRLGALGAVLAASMVASGLNILYYGVLEFQEAGGSVQRASQFLWGNLALLFAFTGFFSAAIWLRHRPEAHERLILLASLAMTPQSLGRIGTFAPLQIGTTTAGSEALYALGGLVLLLSILLVYDLATRRRPHPAVLWGSPLLLGSIVVAGLVIPATSFGQSLVRLIY
jgi:hypothetical protein